MILQNIDFLSPPVSLYFNEKRTHISKISGIIVIIMIICCLSYSIIILYNILNHLNVVSLIYKKFEWEAGYYEMNTTLLFHFFQIFSSENGGFFDKYNSKYIRIYSTYVYNNIEQSQLHNYDHWVFGQCREGIDNKDINKELSQNIINFTNSACIRYYYNSKNQNYYSLGDNGFIWPHLEHGTSHRENVYLTTLFEKCSNNSILTTILGDCASKESIEEYVKKYISLYMYLLDRSVDPTNYTNPFQNNYQIINTNIGNSKTFVENYIHFAPVRMRTKVGDLFGKYEDINSLFFDFNRKGTADSDGKILLKNYYLLDNDFNIYERRYSDFFDILSNIGGASQLFFYFFYTINYIYNYYRVVMDTNHFFCKIQTSSYEEVDKNGRSTIIDPFKDFKTKKNNTINSLNIQNMNPLKDINLNNEIKPENNKFTKHRGSAQLKINNFFLDSKNKSFNQNKDTKYLKSSSFSNNSLDYSNLKFKESDNINNEKKIDSIDLIKNKNYLSQNNVLNSKINNIINSKNATARTINCNKSNNNFIISSKSQKPKKKSFHFGANLKDGNNNFQNKKRKFPFKIRPTFKMNNLEEVLKTQKLNKDLVDKSTNFEKEFSFLYFLLCECYKNKRKKEFKTLYSLISFRKRILSENFIFHQYIINLLIGKKCGIDPHEIKYLV